MTGPGVGKVLLESSVFLSGRQIDSSVYIHLKGQSGATVTHLDIESPELNLMDAKGGFFEISGTDGGIGIALGRNTVKVECAALAPVLPEGRRTRTWVGQKADGIYVGFRRNEMLELEKVGKGAGTPASRKRT